MSKDESRLDNEVCRMTKDSNLIPDQPTSSCAASPSAHECKGRYLMRT